MSRAKREGGRKSNWRKSLRIRDTDVIQASPENLSQQLLDASGVGDVEQVKTLIHLGADPAWKNQFGQTCTHWAAGHGHVDALNVLLTDAKVDVDIATTKLWTPLHYASYNGHFHVCKLLLEHGANALFKNSQDTSPLEVAKTREIKQLLKSKAGGEDRQDKFHAKEAAWKQREGHLMNRVDELEDQVTDLEAEIETLRAELKASKRSKTEHGKGVASTPEEANADGASGVGEEAGDAETNTDSENDERSDEFFDKTDKPYLEPGAAGETESEEGDTKEGYEPSKKKQESKKKKNPKKKKKSSSKDGKEGQHRHRKSTHSNSQDTGERKRLRKKKRSSKSKE